LSIWVELKCRNTRDAPSIYNGVELAVTTRQAVQAHDNLAVVDLA
jgi:hypothetical protein